MAKKKPKAFYLLTASFKAAPALNVTAVRAAIVTGAPVCGFLPLLAALSDTPKVPNPTKVVFSPFFSASVIASNVASIARVASAFVKPVFSATASTNSTFFVI